MPRQGILTIFTKNTDIMNNALFSLILALILAVYFVFLYKKTSRKRDGKVLAWAFTLLFTAGLIIHFIIYYRTAVSRDSLYDIVTISFYAIQHALKMFLGGSPVFRMLEGLKSLPLLYYLFIPVFFMSLMTSGFFIFNFISKILYSRRWLNKSESRRIAKKGGNSIFLGMNRYAEILAGSLKNSSDRHGGVIMLVELPSKEDGMKKLSIWDIMRQFIAMNKKAKKTPFDIILKVSDSMKGIMAWLENPDNDVYILSEDVAANILIVEKLMEDPRIRCHIYCHARKEGLIAKYDNVADMTDQLTIIDSSTLAVECLKRKPELHPVNFVEVGTDESGRKAGWVSDKGFTAAVLGFGETGKECLSFLYEFGTFPDVRKNKAPFRCYVFDNDLEKASSDFLRRTPGMDRNDIVFMSDGINTPAYWTGIKKMTDDLNYVMISLGDDKLNLNTAIELAEYAYRYRKTCDPSDNLKNFVILFRLCDPEKMDIMTLNSANEVFGNCLRPFGNIEEIWNHDVISRSSMDEIAERYYTSYEMLSSGSVMVSWHDKLKSRTLGTYKDRCKVARQVAQTYSNCLHKETKKRICDPYYHDFARYIAMPSEFDGSRHYIGGDSQEGDVMEYLAVGEKLRWNASHEILGYVKGEVTDDQMKTHQYLCGYDDLDAKTRHYDWLVVRNSLI